MSLYPTATIPKEAISFLFLGARKLFYLTQRLSFLSNLPSATDLGDKKLKELRNGRWEKAFANDETSVSTDAWGLSDVDSAVGFESQSVKINRKATIVIEHLIQAADVAHMSQHWHIYRKWNRLLFLEMYKAWLEGRAETSPAEGWYKGEIG